MAEAKPKPALALTPGKVAGQKIVGLSERRTPELIIAFVGPVGAGVSKTSTILSGILKERFNYEPHYIRVSDIIADRADKLKKPISPAIPQAERISQLQQLGTEFRMQWSKSYLAEKCVENIAVWRAAKTGNEEEAGTVSPSPMRVVHLIDSLKNPAEVELLKEVYGDTFWLIGVFAPDNIRQNRLLNLGVAHSALPKIIDTDEEAGVGYGQRVRETIHMADFFIRNDGENDVRLKSVVTRYLEILFDIGVHTPTQDEAAMYSAASSASGSACLSRQVGAAIYSHSGELIGVGANDVPKKGGGLYTTEDGEEDHRCYKWGGKICHNDERKGMLYSAIQKVLEKEQLLVLNAESSKVRNALAQTEVKDLIEYSRAVHAEMEAIISVARGNKHGIVGATMYVTTFPCHHCARHIIASGIDRVIYIEPYAKSLALVLHSDAISTVRNDSKARVAFLQYEGVAPKNIIRLFKHGLARKEGGKLLERNPLLASPVFPAPLDGFQRREDIIVKQIVALETEAESDRESGDGKEKAGGAAQLSLNAGKDSR
ncbi:MAG TPA: anti-phage dCTP deaminase [Candidatus Binataceae bacterium]|nr:anti-phage dCTP deaminase [Candidatus Binataceae bacterium]